METKDLIKVADLTAYTAHYGQTDKQGQPYINHPRAVASTLDDETEKVAALLHDVIEDTPLTADDLRPVFGDEITDILNLLTHNPENGYFNYVRNIRDSGNQHAINVKIADLRHNSQPERNQNAASRMKYELALGILLNDPERHAYDPEHWIYYADTTSLYRASVNAPDTFTVWSMFGIGGWMPLTAEEYIDTMMIHEEDMDLVTSEGLYYDMMERRFGKK